MRHEVRQNEPNLVTISLQQSALSLLRNELGKPDDPAKTNSQKRTQFRDSHYGSVDMMAAPKRRMTVDGSFLDFGHTMGGVLIVSMQASSQEIRSKVAVNVGK